MAPTAPHEQLRRARTQRQEDVATLSARTGLRVHHIRAIEDGRFDDLPRGIYGRAAIRTLATACGLDPDTVLADCSGLLPGIEDPIDGLARLRGVPPASERHVHTAPLTTTAVERRWRPFAAATVDAVITGVLLLAACAGAALLARVSIPALDASVSLFLIGLIFAGGYYLWLGGLAGTTFGEYAVGPEPLHRDPRPLTLRAIARRTLAAATADVRAIRLAGISVNRRFTRGGGVGTAPPPAPSPSPPPPPGREEALTWSMNRRASVPPPPLRPRHG